MPILFSVWQFCSNVGNIGPMEVRIYQSIKFFEVFANAGWKSGRPTVYCERIHGTSMCLAPWHFVTNFIEFENLLWSHLLQTHIFRLGGCNSNGGWGDLFWTESISFGSRKDLVAAMCLLGHSFAFVSPLPDPKFFQMPQRFPQNSFGISQSFVLALPQIHSSWWEQSS